MFDIPPPENDDDAIKLGNKIRNWIKNDRPKSKIVTKEKDDDIKPKFQSDDVPKPDKEEKPKKKRGLFGFLRK